VGITRSAESRLWQRNAPYKGEDFIGLEEFTLRVLPLITEFRMAMYACTIICILLSCPYVFVAGVQCVTSAFGVEPRRMLRIIQRFGRHCSFHLQGECVVVGRV
jgi:hypothetical protein